MQTRHSLRSRLYPARRSIIVAALLLLLSAKGTANDDFRVLPPKIHDAATSRLLYLHLETLCGEALSRRREQYEALRTPEDIAAYQKRLRAFFLDAVGAFPEKTPLNPKTLSVEQRNGYRFEKVLYESLPQFYVTANLYLPDGNPPFPGVIVPCGHSANGKAYEQYQRISISLALNGIAALCYDPISQGERGQLPSESGTTGRSPTYRHMMLSTGSILLGRNTAHYRIWDGIRALDYLAARPEIDPTRLGCTGNSGGGTLTSYLMALDDRIRAAAPSCYLTSLERLIATIGPQDAEQNIHGQIAFGMNHADYIIMRAPKPTLICVGTRDYFDIDGAWDSFRQAKRIYARLGFPERVELVEADERHGFTLPLRTGTVRWMRRWLLGVDDAVVEPEIEVRPDNELLCLPEGTVLKIPGSRSAYDFNIDLEKQFAEKRRQFWKTTEREQAMKEVRRIAGIRPLAELSRPAIEKTATLPRDGYSIEKLILTPEHGVPVPALFFRPSKIQGQDLVLYVHGEGKQAETEPGGEILQFVEAGIPVLTMDLPGTGETAPTARNMVWAGLADWEWREAFLLYHLGRSLLGMRAEDLLVCARLAVEGGLDGSPRAVRLVAVGKMGPPALHAAALEPALFASVRIERSLVSWSRVIHQKTNQRQFANAVHGALQVYDLPDLAGSLPQGKIEIRNPLDAENKPLQNTGGF